MSNDLEIGLEKDVTTIKKSKEPVKYNVIFYNDDFTPFEFVITLLVQIFKKSPEEAIFITKNIHTKEKDIVGTYVHEIALTKKEIVDLNSRSNGYPLKCEIEQVQDNA